MSKRIIGGLILLMSISLLGIIAVQILWIKNAIQIEKKTLGSNINKALHIVVDKLEENESVIFLSKELHNAPKVKFADVKIHDIKQFIDKKKSKIQHRFTIKTKEKFNNSTSKIKSSDTLIVVNENNSKDKSLHLWHSNAKGDSLVNIDIKVTSNDTIIRAKTKEKQIENILEKVVYEFKSQNNSILDRIDKNKLVINIEDELANFGIKTNFDFAVIDNHSQQTVLTSDSTLNAKFINSKYKVDLFPNDIFQNNKQLVLYFPDQFNLVYKSISDLLLLSTVFTLFIIITFLNAVFFILKQKRINDIKSDFINNITHEFKTPIATIMLASDAINNPKVIDKPDKIRYFTSIIKDESFRMNKQVENILQLSLFGKQELELNLQTCHVNEIIQKSADHIKLLIDEKQGNITTNLKAINDICNLDEVHFMNVLFNLFDNSIKYSCSILNIEIGTDNVNQEIYIWITDSGIGMNPKTLSKIFKKFYRAQTGNIHNVKGFGLGLSYVKLIIERHCGRIVVSSKPNHGTTIGIYLPLRSLK